MKQDNFSSYHPIINFVYFVLVIGYSMFIMHPVFLGLSCVGGMAYYTYLKKWKALKNSTLDDAAGISYISGNQSFI